ncbi:hypothetical protein ACWCPQ_31070 [Nocardia sp. NPDC001965]
MALIEIDDLPAPTIGVLRRRARVAGISVREQVRREVIATAQRRSPLDDVVEFLRAERPEYREAEIDTGTMALIHADNLPAGVWGVLTGRAAAAGLPLRAYVRSELNAVARRGSVDDALREIDEALGGNPDGIVDMAEVAESVRYARAL